MTGETHLGLDLGTSGVKALLIDDDQTVLAEASAALSVSRPLPLWSEQDPEAWWAATLVAVAAVRARAPEAFTRLVSIGLSGQMHGAVLLAAGGEVLRPAILWDDGRSGAECAALERLVPDLAARAANIAMPGFTAPKLLWVARHEPAVFAAIRTVLLPKDYLRYRLSGVLATECSDASGTLWLDVAGRRWDAALLAATGLDEGRMPALFEGSDATGVLSGEVAGAWGLGGRRVVIAGGGGDNAASAVGIGAVAAGDGFVSLGTSGVVFSATDRLAALPERTLHAFCHALPGRWHAMSVMLSAGASLAWLAGLLGRDAGALVEAAARFADDAAAVAGAPLFLPYLAGERTPHNDPDLAASLLDVRAGHGAAAVAYAVLEGVCFGLADGLAVLDEAGAGLRRCAIVGGGARGGFWTRLLADVLGMRLEQPAQAAIAAALGAARLGMLAAGRDRATVLVWREGGSVEPAPTPVLAERRGRFAEAVSRRRR